MGVLSPKMYTYQNTKQYKILGPKVSFHSPIFGLCGMAVVKNRHVKWIERVDMMYVHQNITVKPGVYSYCALGIMKKKYRSTKIKHS